MSDAILRDGWGILDQIRLSHHRPMDFKDALTTRIVDAAYAVNGSDIKGGEFRASPYFLNVMGGRKTYWIDITKEQIESINQKNPWDVIHLVVSKGALGEENPPEDSGVLHYYSGLGCWEAADDEVIYELVKFLDENAEEWSNRTNKQMGGEYLASLAATEAEFHPGAVKYFKEHNIEIGG